MSGPHTSTPVVSPGMPTVYVTLEGGIWRLEIPGRADPIYDCECCGSQLTSSRMAIRAALYHQHLAKMKIDLDAMTEKLRSLT